MIKDLEEEACLPGHAFFVPFPVFSGKIFVCEKTEKNNQENLLNLHNHPLSGLVVKKNYAAGGRLDGLNGLNGFNFWIKLF